MDLSERAPEAHDPNADGAAPLIARAGPWLFWGTMLWMGAAFIAWAAAQACAMFVMLLPVLSARPGVKIDAALVMSNPDAISATILCSTPFALAVLALAIRSRRWDLREYVAWRGFSWRQFALGFALLAGVLIAAEGIGALLGRESQPEFMKDMIKAVRSGNAAWLLLFAGIIVAPLGEELMFRGFLFRGMAASRAGLIGAIIISAALWALIHTQYDAYYVGLIFIIGLALGFIRSKSGSTALTFVLHALLNAVAFAQALLPDSVLGI